MQRQNQNSENMQSLFQYIPKNKFIPEFLANLSPEDEKLQLLTSAITTANFDATIFKDPNCYLYLLYLMQNNHIEFWQGITIYLYLLALIQFASTEQDKKFFIDKFAENNTLTEQGETFLNGLVKNLQELGCNTTYESLKNKILLLPASEQALLRLPFMKTTTLFQNNNYQGMMTLLLSNNSPFLVNVKQENNAHYFWLPSANVYQLILKEISPTPVQAKVIFGTVSSKTLCTLHENGEHPCALFAEHVKSSMKTADGYDCGPLAIYIHDLAHTVWGSMLTKAQRDYIFKTHLPSVQLLKNNTMSGKDNETIDELINGVIDFDLLPPVYKNKDTRFGKYLQGSFRSFLLKKLSAEGKAHVLVTLSRICLSLDEKSDERKLWQDYLNEVLNIFEKKNLPAALALLPHTLEPMAKVVGVENAFIGYTPDEKNSYVVSSSFEENKFYRGYLFGDRKTATQESFWMVGTPINVKASYYNLFSSFRSGFSKEEISETFPSSGEICLFADMDDAIRYARKLRVGNIYNDDVCLSGAIFKVKLNTSPQLLKPKYATLKINEEGKDENCSSSCTVLYFNVDVKNVTPLTACMTIEKINRKIEYDEINLVPEQKNILTQTK